MSRTDELRKGGASDRTGGGGGAPFVKFGDRYAWVEGDVLKVWESKFGDAVTMKVTNASEGLQAKGKDEDGREFTEIVMAGSEVNVGLNNKALEGAIRAEDTGRSFHVAFEGWEESKASGNKYRVFTVLDITREHEAPKRSAEGIEPWPDDEEVEQEAAASYAPDDDLPF